MPESKSNYQQPLGDPDIFCPKEPFTKSAQQAPLKRSFVKQEIIKLYNILARHCVQFTEGTPPYVFGQHIYAFSYALMTCMSYIFLYWL